MGGRGRVQARWEIGKKLSQSFRIKGCNKVRYICVFNDSSYYITLAEALIGSEGMPIKI